MGSTIQSFILIFSLFTAYKRECMTDEGVSPSPSESAESPVSTEPPTMEHICRANRDTCRTWGVDSQYFNISCYYKLFGVIHACYPICKPGAASDHVDECQHYCRSKQNKFLPTLRTDWCVEQIGIHIVVKSFSQVGVSGKWATWVFTQLWHAVTSNL